MVKTNRKKAAKSATFSHPNPRPRHGIGEGGRYASFVGGELKEKRRTRQIHPNPYSQWKGLERAQVALRALLLKERREKKQVKPQGKKFPGKRLGKGWGEDK